MCIMVMNFLKVLIWLNAVEFSFFPFMIQLIGFFVEINQNNNEKVVLLLNLTWNFKFGDIKKIPLLISF